jgi:hypothetical protein
MFRTQPADRPRCATSQKISPSRPSHTAVHRGSPVRRPVVSSRASPGMGYLGPRQPDGRVDYRLLEATKNAMASAPHLSHHAAGSESVARSQAAVSASEAG